MPNTMSCVGTAPGAPLEGDRMLLADSMSTCASICASMESGTCTAIWSPSKSALNAVQTSGWISIALPSTRIGSNAWMPSRWSVGARFRSTGCSLMTSSRMSPTSGRSFSTNFFAALIEDAMPRSSSLRRVKGCLNQPLVFGDVASGLLEVDEPLERLVRVEATGVGVVEIRRRKAPAVEGHERPELRRDDRDDLEDHPVGLVARLEERLDDLQALDDLLPLLHRRLAEHLGPEVARERVELHVAPELAGRLRAHPHRQAVGAALLRELARLVHREQVLLLHALDLRVQDHVLLEVQDLLQLAAGHVENLAAPPPHPLYQPPLRHP